MRALIICLLIAAIPLLGNSQEIPQDSKVIVVKNVGFLQVCNALLDSGYNLEKKDNELQTAKTEFKKYLNKWDAAYSISIRVKDSVAYLTAIFTCPAITGQLFSNEPAWMVGNKKGKFYKPIFSLPFIWTNNFAHTFRKEIIYSKD